MRRLTNESEIDNYLRKVIGGKFDEFKNDIEDTSVNAILMELAVFIRCCRYVKIDELEIDRGCILVKLCSAKNNARIYYTEIRGDNLGTRKKMLWSLCRLTGDKNNKDIFSYIFFPYSAGKGSINCKRATCKGYNDNLFSFFKSLQQMYEADFRDEDCGDKVQKCICNYKEFWRLFGKGNKGYLNYMDSFCLKFVDELEKKYPQFYQLTIYSSASEGNDILYSQYNELLSEFQCERMKVIEQRLKERGLLVEK